MQKKGLPISEALFLCANRIYAFAPFTCTGVPPIRFSTGLGKISSNCSLVRVSTSSNFWAISCSLSSYFFSVFLASS